MLLIDEIAEARIVEAIERGDLSDLLGEGEKLDLDMDPFVPEELRMAYRILKNSGFVPEELRLRRQISDINELLRTVGPGGPRSRAMKRLDLLRAQLGLVRGNGANGVFSEERYFPLLVDRLERR